MNEAGQRAAARLIRGDTDPQDPQTAPWRTPPGKVRVVLPAYNEARDVGPLLEAIDQAMFDDGLEYAIIVVDDGSVDGTLEEVERRAAFIPVEVLRHESNRGLGETIRDGLREAATVCSERDIIVVMDADNTHLPGLIRAMTRRIQEGADVVIASRFRSGADVRGVPLHRRLLSRGASWILRAIFPIHGVRDYTCGYRAYRAPVLALAFERYGEEFINEDGFQCMVDILLKLRTLDVVFAEVPLILRYDQKAGASKMRVMSTVVNTLSLMARRRVGR
jgi:dolichol-phosphate mannosyltransferase